jgi:hypothetical protein
VKKVTGERGRSAVKRSGEKKNVRLKQKRERERERKCMHDP